jgi:hypothetical protein
VQPRGDAARLGDQRDDATGGTQYGYFVSCTYDGNVGDCNGGELSDPDSIVFQIGGTSASTPSFAGVVALANQAAGGRLGNLNPLIYSLPSTAYNDVKLGNNEVLCQAGSGGDPGCPVGAIYGYAATDGYDCASGRGSVDATNWIDAITSLSSSAVALSASSTTSVVPGTKIDLTGTVTSGGSVAIGGTVTFGFQSYRADGVTPDLSWTFNSATITGGTAASGAAEVSTVVPAGLVSDDMFVDVYAEYGGDATHLTSVSSKKRISFTKPSFCMDSSVVTATVADSGTLQIATQNGATPIQYFIPPDTDYTADANTGVGSTITSTGLLTVGDTDGWVIVVAIDANGSETVAEITVGDPASTGAGVAPWVNEDAGGAITGQNYVLKRRP